MGQSLFIRVFLGFPLWRSRKFSVSTIFLRYCIVRLCSSAAQCCKYMQLIMKFDQQVIFCTPIPANAFSTEPLATTISTVPFSSYEIMRPKASEPAIRPCVTPLCGTILSTSGQLGNTMALRYDLNLSFTPKYLTKRQMCSKGCQFCKCEGINYLSLRSRGRIMNAKSKSCNLFTKFSQNSKFVSYFAQSTTISSISKVLSICLANSLHCLILSSSPISIKLNPFFAKNCTQKQLYLQSAIIAHAICPYLSSSCCFVGTLGFDLRAFPAREIVLFAKAATPTMTAKLTKDLLQLLRSKSRKRSEGRRGKAFHMEFVVVLRLFSATVAAPIISNIYINSQSYQHEKNISLHFDLTYIPITNFSIRPKYFLEF